jgi:outer membrane protein TolC
MLCRQTLGCLLLLLLALPTSSMSQSPPPPPHAPFRAAVLPGQWRPGVPPSEALAVPSPITRDTQIERVSLKEAIAIALEHNPGIAARRLEPTRLGADVLRAQGAFDPSFNSELNYGHGETPNASVLGGAQASVVEDRYANFHLVKMLRTGTQLSLDSLNDRYDNNSAFNQLRPQYKPEVGFSLVQPLLRGFGWDFSYLVVRVAEETAEAAVYQYEATLADFVEQVIEAYWGVVRARENLGVQRESKALADRTVEENQARVRVGLLPPVATLEAQADAMARAEQVIIAENALRVARQQLAQLAYYRPDGTFVPRTLEPAEDVVPEDVRIDADETLAAALASRPEIQASARTLQAQQLGEKVAANGLLPRVDLLGSYGTNALSGTNRPTSFGSNLKVSRTPTPGAQCTFLSADLGYLCRTPPIGASPFAGSAHDAYDRLGEFQSYAVGVRVEVPFANAAAEGEYTMSRILRDQAELGHRDLLSRVTLEVEQSVSDVLSSRQRIDTSRVARELAEENLRNQEKRHEVGMATTKDLLDFQTRLTTARGAEVQAKTDYATAVARWRRAQGRLLEHYQIVIAHGEKPSAPWFTRF